MTECDCYNIYPGSVIRLTGQFYDQSGTLVDPTTVLVDIKLPDGTPLANLTAVRDSTGTYHYDYTPEQSGLYVYRFTGSGAVVAINQATFQIGISSF